MDTDELGPYEERPETLLLATIERAERQGGGEVWVPHLAEHLGFRPSAHTTRRLRLQLERLRVAGELRSATRHGREQWALTGAGRERLARERRSVGELAEAPQHRRWRQARSQAAERIAGFRALALGAAADAEAALAQADPVPSETWFELGERLGAAMWLLGSATHCLSEWPEPEDSRADVDDCPWPSPSRRSLLAWSTYELKARHG